MTMVFNVIQLSIMIVLLNCFYCVVKKFVDELLAIREKEQEEQYAKLQHIDIRV